MVALRRALNQWYHLDNTLTDAPKDPKVQAAREALVVQQGALFRASITRFGFESMGTWLLSTS